MMPMKFPTNIVVKISDLIRKNLASNWRKRIKRAEKDKRVRSRGWKPKYIDRSRIKRENNQRDGIRHPPNFIWKPHHLRSFLSICKDELLLSNFFKETNLECKKLRSPPSCLQAIINQIYEQKK
jgi:hypothetical protein